MFHVSANATMHINNRVLPVVMEVFAPICCAIWNTLTQAGVTCLANEFGIEEYLENR